MSKQLTARQLLARLTCWLVVLPLVTLPSFFVFNYFGEQYRDAKYSETGDVTGVIVLTMWLLVMLTVIGVAIGCDIVKRREAQ